MNAYFITWMLLFPISTALTEYIVALRRAKSGELYQFSGPAEALVAFVEVAMWWGIGYSLYS